MQLIQVTHLWWYGDGERGVAFWTILFNTVLKSEGKSGGVALSLCRQKEAYKG